MLLTDIHLTALSAYMCFECIHQAIRGGYSLFGNGVDSSENGIPVCGTASSAQLRSPCSCFLQMARIIWIFYVSKVAEFGDTVSFAEMCHCAVHSNLVSTDHHGAEEELPPDILLARLSPHQHLLHLVDYH